MPTYLSLFSGIGGLDRAAESLGYECVGQVENDDHCSRVLERHWPTVRRWKDVHDFTAAAYADSRRREVIGIPQPAGVGASGQTLADTERGSDELRRGSVHLASAAADPEGEGDQRQRSGGTARSGGARVDLIIGGFPCQPASQAGGRRGTDDDRWLWPAFARIVGELRPSLVLVENVTGLLTVNGGRAFSEVLGTLADLGYDATWTSVRASDVGAPHRRERIFILAQDADGEPSESRGRRGTESADHARSQSAQRNGRGFPRETEQRPDVADTEDGGVRRGEPSGSAGLAEPDDPPTSDSGGQRLEGQGSGQSRGGPVAPPGVAPDARGMARPTAVVERDRSDEDRLASPRGGPRSEIDHTPGGDHPIAPDTEDADGRTGADGDATYAGEQARDDAGGGAVGFPWGNYAPAIERWERVMGPAPAPIDDRGRLAGDFVGWMMGFPAGWTDGMSRTQRLKALGNAVVPQQGACAFNALLRLQEIG